MPEVTLRFQSVSDWSSEFKAKEYLEILMNHGGIFSPVRYISEGSRKLKFDPNNLSTPIKGWQIPYVAGIDIEGPGYHAGLYVRWVLPESATTSMIIGGIDHEYFLVPSHIHQFLGLMKRLYTWGDILHGFICLEDDFKRKNVLRDGGTPGMSLDQCLPGIYWANFFGPLYVDFFGREKFLSAPAYYIEELPDGGYLLLTAPSPLEYRSSSVQRLEASLLNHLGEKTFFNRRHPERECHVPDIGLRHNEQNVSEVDPIPEIIPDARAFMKEAPAIARQFAAEQGLDFSMESLRRLDRYILRQAKELNELPEDNTESVQLVRDTTAYYGEVIRQTFHGKWIILSKYDPPQPAVRFKDADGISEELVFVSVYKLWLEHEPSDGLAKRFVKIR